MSRPSDCLAPLWLAVWLFSFSTLAFAGGPAYVAGSGFDEGMRGQPLTWANGTVQYYTDQGNLSPILSGPDADMLVADVVGRWTTTPGVVLSVTRPGHLAEDVSGDNVRGYPNGTYTIPNDIQPGASGTPVGIVYDYDGKVTDALLGQGAGGSDLCFTNAVYGGADNYSSDAHFTHALIVINGMCAASNAQLPEVRYRLARIFGRVFGIGWSQANLNVITGNPRPSSDDFAGFPLMHSLDPASCVPITLCYPDPDTPKMDDRAALRNLYPKAPMAGRIHGSVYFTDADGNPTQAMQGVNVVARRIDSGQPSRKSVIASVSGFAFTGNAGNVVNGVVDAHGRRFDFFGSADRALEGAFDIPVEIPDGSNSAQFQLSVEGVDSFWSNGVGPYAPYAVAPSGSFAPVIVTVARGGDVAQDILMQASAIARPHPGSGGTYDTPARMPDGGGWGAWISGYGDGDWFQFPVKANRTLSVTTTARDETGVATTAKLMPVIGIWALSDQSGGPAPAATSTAFNTTLPGTTRLDAQFFADDVYRFGINDLRGDGRPDYFYTASVLYSDTVTPARVGMRGGPVGIYGLGFNPGVKVSVGSANGHLLGTAANDLQAVVPTGTKDGTATLVVSDPATGGFSQMIDALTYGAAASDKLVALQTAEPTTIVGAEAANPIRVRAVAADGVTPVAGATVAWSTTNGAVLSACGGVASCSVLTDEAGVASTGVTPTAAGTSTVTIALAPASYNPPQSKQATVSATMSALDLAAVAPTKYIAQGATVDVPLSVRVLSRGTPQVGAVVNFGIAKGTVSLSATSATTNGSGYASIVAHLTNHNGDVQVWACVSPNNAPCQTFTMFATPSSRWTLETVSGSAQMVTAGQAFQPLQLRVTDGPSPANPVMGVSLVFDVTLMRFPKNNGGGGGGDDGHGGGNGTPVILGTYQVQAVSDASGVATMLPSVKNVQGYCDVMIGASAGLSSLQFDLEMLTAMPGPVKKAPPERADDRRRRPLRGQIAAE